jgi:DNA-binding MarR family transcriptional regulator
VLERHRDSADERRVLLLLTAQGRALKRRAGAVPAAVACAAGCPLDELTSLTARLKALRVHLTESTPRAA